MEDFLDYWNSIIPLEKGTVDFLKENLEKIEIPKKGFVLTEGQICRNIYFITTGLLRCFHLQNGKEISSAFMKEGDIVVSVKSFFNQSISRENIQAIEDCSLFVLSYDELQVAYNSFPDFNTLGRILTEKYYQLSEQSIYSLRMHNAREKYLLLLNHFPQIAQRVPLKHIASYLSITQETLSRIRSQKY